MSEKDTLERESRDSRETGAIAACMAGRLEGLEYLYEAYRAPVFRTCLRLLVHTPSAEDATQEVFLRAFERIRTYDRRAAFSTWLYRLTVNHCLNQLDRNQRRAALPMDDVREPRDPSHGPETVYLGAERERLLTHALGRLSIEHRTVLVLREMEDLGYREIAAVLDVPVGTVMSRLCRAREALRKVWIAESARLVETRAEEAGDARGTLQESS